MQVTTIPYLLFSPINRTFFISRNKKTLSLWFATKSSFRMNSSKLSAESPQTDPSEPKHVPSLSKSSPAIKLQPSLLEKNRQKRMQNPSEKHQNNKNPSEKHENFQNPSEKSYKMQNPSGKNQTNSSTSRSDREISALGRFLTRILRHKAPEYGLQMRSDGFVPVSDVLKLRDTTKEKIPICQHSVDDIREAVCRDDKQRFGLLEENGQLLIRANQGHSVNIVEAEKLFEKEIKSHQEVPVCVHGTYKKYLKSIKEKGLMRMNRQHIHFAQGLPKTGVISGMRSNCEVVIYLDVEKALKDGMKLYRSANNVILTEGFDGIVPPNYFKDIQILK